MSSGSVVISSNADIDAVVPIVEIDGNIKQYAYCMAVQSSGGTAPGVALIQFLLNSDSNSPLTLQDFGEDFRLWSRVRIFANGYTIFDGQLIKRRDTVGRQGESVVYEAWDCRWWLNFIPLRGALVWDDDAEEVKFLTRYHCQTNPGGRWNCIGASIGGTTYPVFSQTAEFKRTYQAPDEVFEGRLSSGELTAWTPRRWLQYLQLYTNMDRGDVPGTDHDEWRSINNTNRLYWYRDSINIIGADTAQGYDPLDRKMPDVSFRGMTVLGALNKGLDVCGTHKLRIDTNRVEFYPIFVSGRRRNQDLDQEIRMERGGDATNAETAFAFDLEEDASQVNHAALVEGAPVHVESNFVNDGATDTIIPGWTIDEQTALVNGVQGTGEAGSSDYACYPLNMDDPYTLDGIANGTDGAPYAEKNTAEAAALLRQFFPKVFKNFVIDTDACITEGITDGVENEYDDDDEYPQLLGIGRPVLPEQLQYYISEVAGVAEGRLPSKFPIRIRVEHDSNYYDVPFNIGLRMDGDGSFWLDGIAEDADGETHCIYSGSLLSTDTITLKKFKMNLAVSLDHRVKGYVEATTARNQLDHEAGTALGGPLLRSIDSPDGYKEDHQINSEPAALDSVFGGRSGSSSESLPLTRYVPPGSERDHAEFAAKRAMSRNEWVKRFSSWKLIGIRPQYKAGTWITKVRLIGESSTTEYRIDAPVEHVTYDFMNQITIVGGLISELGDANGNGLDVGEGAGTPGELPAEAAQPIVAQEDDETKKRLAPQPQAKPKPVPAMKPPAPPEDTLKRELTRDEANQASAEQAAGAVQAGMNVYTVGKELWNRFGGSI